MHAIELHPRSSGHVRFRPPSQPPPVAVVPLSLSVVTLLEMRSETLVEEAASARAEVIATDAALAAAAAVTLLLSVYPPTSLN